MTLLITVIAAVSATAVWYFLPSRKSTRLSILALIYWGASIMWLVDAVAEFFEVKAEYFIPSTEEMINDTFLGFTVVALGLVIWLAVVMISDPRGVLKRKLTGRESN